MLKAVQKNTLFQYILLLVLSLALWGKTFWEGGYADWRIWTAWILTLGSSAGFGFIISGHKLSRNPGFLSILFLCLVSTHIGRGLEARLWLYPLGLLILHYMLGIYAKDRSYPAIFNMSFFWALLTLLSPGLFLTLPCLFLILLAYSLNKWQEWMCVLMGIVSTYLLFLAGCFLSGHMSDFPAISEFFPIGLLEWQPDYLLTLTVAGLCAVCSLISVLSLRDYLIDMEISERHKISAMACVLVYFAAFAVFIGVPLSSRLFFICFPLVFFTGKFLQKQGRGIIKELCFDAILILSVLQSIL